MKRDQRARDEMLAHCNQLTPEDGLDPREWYVEEQNSQRHNRKTQQLCRQVQRTLEMVFGDTGDEELDCLRVLSVTPAPNASQMLVTLQADVPPEDFDREALLARLASFNGQLRSEVAADITRKKTPQLLYHVVGPHCTD